VPTAAGRMALLRAFRAKPPICARQSRHFAAARGARHMSEGAMQHGPGFHDRLPQVSSRAASRGARSSYVPSSNKSCRNWAFAFQVSRGNTTCRLDGAIQNWPHVLQPNRLAQALTGACPLLFRLLGHATKMRRTRSRQIGSAPLNRKRVCC
jgi:hypothetical protein